MDDKSQTTDPTEEDIAANARRWGLDCDYVDPKHCAFLGTDRCCRGHMKDPAIVQKENASGQTTTWSPCRTGIHVTGTDEEANRFTTVLNIPLAADVARYSFASALAELGDLGPFDSDLTVDLRIDGDLVLDFGIRRQMLARLQEIVQNA